MQNNTTRKAERRAKLATNKSARNAAGVTMFNPSVTKRTVNIGSSPLGANTFNSQISLRAPNLFTGNATEKHMTPQQIKKIQLLGLPTSQKTLLTANEQARVNAITAENYANTLATKSASQRNARGVNGEQYLYNTVHPKTQANLLELESHRKQELAQTRYVPAAMNLEAKAKHLRYNLRDEAGARRLLKQAEEIRAREGYTVAQPTSRSLANAEAYHEFAKKQFNPGKSVNVRKSSEVRQSSPGFLGGLFSSCFGDNCSAVDSSVYIRNPLPSHGGRSRRHRRKISKSRNKRVTHKH